MTANPQADSAQRVSALGYQFTNAYGDGPIRMERDRLVVFIEVDGSVVGPMTNETWFGKIEMREAGIETFFPGHQPRLVT